METLDEHLGGSSLCLVVRCGKWPALRMPVCYAGKPWLHRAAFGRLMPLAVILNGIGAKEVEEE
jgi:hypothetical protein